MRHRSVAEIIHVAGFRLRLVIQEVWSVGRTISLRFWGMRIGKGTRIPCRFEVNWPHQVSLGSSCTLESSIHIKFDGCWKPGPSIVIGDGVFLGNGVEFNITCGIVIQDGCAIASGCRFIDHDHLVDQRGGIVPGKGPEGCIRIGKKVWLGADTIVLKGVEIGDGAVIGAGSIVTRTVPPGETWLGVPARPIRQWRVQPSALAASDPKL